MSDPGAGTYPSQRVALYAGRGAVGTSQHLAAEAGLEALRHGGNAIDAAITTAACLTVLEPHSNGLGGDAFAIVSTPDGLTGLNASGPSALASDAAYLRRRGFDAMPVTGIYPVTVPGVPAAWAALTQRFGRRTLAENLAPAIDYAERGSVVSPVQHRAMMAGYAQYHALAVGGRPEFATWEQAMCPDGVPAVGQRHRLPLHAASLAAIAESGAEWFYRGEAADRLDAFSRSLDGFLRREDFAAFAPAWVDPVSVDYRGYDVWELPPNGQGLVALMALNILRGFDIPARRNALTWHRAIEAVKLAFADGLAYITDPAYMTVSPSDLLSEEYAAARRRLIGEQALTPYPGTPPKGGTVYLAAADDAGNMISYIQSLYHGYGSGLFIPGTGIALQNRGSEFKLDPAHANYLQPGKRTYHTIIPGFLTKAGVPVGPFGVMGGYMQPQGHTQVIMDTADFGADPQQALDTPRFRWDGGLDVSIERAVGSEVLQDLADRGHRLTVTGMESGYGHGQIIWRAGEGFVGGTEPRVDGAMAMY